MLDSLVRSLHTRYVVTPRVFVVDSDPLIVRNVASSLGQETGFHVQAFTRAATAVAASGDGLDALIAGFPLLSGNGGRLRELLMRDRELVVIAMTRLAERDLTASAVAELGALHHVHKPVDMNDLLPKLRAALKLRVVQKELAFARAEMAQLRRTARTANGSSWQKGNSANDGHAELESVLQTATGRLVQAEQLAAVGRVVSGIAHQLDQQLALVGYAEAIKSRVVDDPEIAEFAEIIVNAQKRLVVLVDQIRDFTERAVSAEPSKSLHREPTDVAAAVDDALALMRYDADVRKRTLARTYRRKPLAYLDRQKFSQVVMNLVSNAVLATERGDTIAIELDVDRNERFAVLRVIDRGVGMTPEVKARLGEPFFTTRGECGSGLGVGICMHIVEQHGGSLTFDSALGEGTRALLTVPIIESRQDELV